MYSAWEFGWKKQSSVSLPVSDTVSEGDVLGYLTGKPVMTPAPDSAYALFLTNPTAVQQTQTSKAAIFRKEPDFNISAEEDISDLIFQYNKTKDPIQRYTVAQAIIIAAVELNDELLATQWREAMQENIADKPYRQDLINAETFALEGKLFEAAAKYKKVGEAIQRDVEAPATSSDYEIIEERRRDVLTLSVVESAQRFNGLVTLNQNNDAMEVRERAFEAAEELYRMKPDEEGIANLLQTYTAFGIDIALMRRVIDEYDSFQENPIGAPSVDLMGLSGSAVASYEGTKKTGPDDLGALKSIGGDIEIDYQKRRVEMMRSLLNEAEERLAAVVKKANGGDNYKANVQLGTAYAIMGNRSRALAYFEAARSEYRDSFHAASEDKVTHITVLHRIYDLAALDLKLKRSVLDEARDTISQLPEGREEAIFTIENLELRANLHIEELGSRLRMKEITEEEYQKWTIEGYEVLIKYCRDLLVLTNDSDKELRRTASGALVKASAEVLEINLGLAKLKYFAGDKEVAARLSNLSVLAYQDTVRKFGFEAGESLRSESSGQTLLARADYAFITGDIAGAIQYLKGVAADTTAGRLILSNDFWPAKYGIVINGKFAPDLDSPSVMAGLKTTIAALLDEQGEGLAACGIGTIALLTVSKLATKVPLPVGASATACLASYMVDRAFVVSRAANSIRESFKTGVSNFTMAEVAGRVGMFAINLVGMYFGGVAGGLAQKAMLAGGTKLGVYAAQVGLLRSAWSRMAFGFAVRESSYVGNAVAFHEVSSVSGKLVDPGSETPRSWKDYFKSLLFVRVMPEVMARNPGGVLVEGNGLAARAGRYMANAIMSAYAVQLGISAVDENMSNFMDKVATLAIELPFIHLGNQAAAKLFPMKSVVDVLDTLDRSIERSVTAILDQVAPKLSDVVDSGHASQPSFWQMPLWKRALLLPALVLFSVPGGGSAGKNQGKEIDSEAKKYIDRLSDADPAVRASAAFHLSRFGHISAVGPFLIEKLNDPDPIVRRVAVVALLYYGDIPEVGSLMIGMLKDSNVSVRVQVVSYLMSRGNYDAVFESLIDFLNDTRSDLRTFAAESLGSTGNRRAVEPLIERLNDSDPNVRRKAAEALGNLGDRRAVQPLIDGLDEYVQNVRTDFIDALGKLGDRRAVGLLTGMLNDIMYNVRSAAAYALKQIAASSAAVDPAKHAARIRAVVRAKFKDRATQDLGFGNRGKRIGTRPAPSGFDFKEFEVVNQSQADARSIDWMATDRLPEDQRARGLVVVRKYHAEEANKVMIVVDPNVFKGGDSVKRERLANLAGTIAQMALSRRDLVGLVIGDKKVYLRPTQNAGQLEAILTKILEGVDSSSESGLAVLDQKVVRENLPRGASVFFISDFDSVKPAAVERLAGGFRARNVSFVPVATNTKVQFGKTMLKIGSHKFISHDGSYSDQTLVDEMVQQKKISTFNHMIESLGGFAIDGAQEEPASIPGYVLDEAMKPPVGRQKVKIERNPNKEIIIDNTLRTPEPANLAELAEKALQSKTIFQIDLLIRLSLLNGWVSFFDYLAAIATEEGKFSKKAGFYDDVTDTFKLNENWYVLENGSGGLVSMVGAKRLAKLFDSQTVPEEGADIWIRDLARVEPEYVAYYREDRASAVSTDNLGLRYFLLNYSTFFDLNELLDIYQEKEFSGSTRRSGKGLDYSAGSHSDLPKVDKPSALNTGVNSPKTDGDEKVWQVLSPAPTGRGRYLRSGAVGVRISGAAFEPLTGMGPEQMAEDGTKKVTGKLKFDPQAGFVTPQPAGGKVLSQSGKKVTYMTSGDALPPDVNAVMQMPLADLNLEYTPDVYAAATQAPSLDVVAKVSPEIALEWKALLEEVKTMTVGAAIEKIEEYVVKHPKVTYHKYTSDFDLATFRQLQGRIAKGEAGLDEYLQFIVFHGGGTCMEMSTVGVTLLRLAGIPAGVSNGWAAKKDGKVTMEAHAWAEVIVPRGGGNWAGIPVEFSKTYSLMGELGRKLEKKVVKKPEKTPVPDKQEIALAQDKEPVTTGDTAKKAVPDTIPPIEQFWKGTTSEQRRTMSYAIHTLGSIIDGYDKSAPFGESESAREFWLYRLQGEFSRELPQDWSETKNPQAELNYVLGHYKDKLGQMEKDTPGIVDETLALWFFMLQQQIPGLPDFLP